MNGDGTGTSENTDRCGDCGHLLDVWCDDECCWWKADRFLEALMRDVQNF